MASEATETSDMHEERRPSLWPIWLLTATLAACVAILLVPVWAIPGPFGTVPVPWIVLLVGFALAELYTLNLRFRGEAHSFSLSEIVVVVGLFAVTPAGLIVAELAASVFVLLVLCRATPVKICFNTALYVLSTEVALLVFHGIAGGGGPLEFRSWAGALLGAMLASLLQFVGISLAVSFAEGRVATRELAQSLCWGSLSALVNTMLGLVVVIVCSESLVASLLLIGPVAVVFVAYRAYVSEHSKSEGLQFLYRASELLSGARDLEAGLVALLDFARDSFHTEVAQIVLRGEDGETVGYRTSAGPGDHVSRLEPCDLAHVECAISLLEGADDIVIKRFEDLSEIGYYAGTDLAVAMLASLQDESGVRGVVLIGRQRGTSYDAFDRDEVRLFDTFVNHLRTTMEKSRLSTSLAQLRVLKQELAHQAYHDSLTGLANRLKFRDLVDIALVNAARDSNKAAVLFIDLDDFKTVNDTMGHAAGDALLEEVARRIAASVGAAGTAARLGGDEFAVLLPVVSNDSEVRAVAERILVALGDPVDVAGQSVVAQASIGIASHVGAADAAELMQHADVAMYTAKRNGKGRFDEFEPSMSLTVARRHQLKVGLERALADNEFLLHYQPVIDAARGTIMGTEALLRWRDPTRGLMPPTEFVGVAEETGLIVPIGRRVLFDAFRQAAEWVPRSPHLQVFVNLSTRQLADPDIVHDVRSALGRSGLDPSHVVLEVTETAMMRDIDEAKATLRALKLVGVNLAIDDFGTGFSSLSYLRELPIDVLKIAKPIIDAICESPQDAAFVKGIIELGHVVGLKVVAEGVEQVEQYAHLIGMGCDYVQGYYYAPSMDPTEITETLAVNPVVARQQFEAVRLAG